MRSPKVSKVWKTVSFGSKDDITLKFYRRDAEKTQSAPSCNSPVSSYFSAFFVPS